MSFSTSPQIITMWISGPIASALLTGIGWRWGFGIFSIALPLATLPFITLVLWNQRKAFRTGLLPRKTANKIPDTPESAFSTLKRIFLQIDLPGLFILLCGLSLFLLPFTLYSFQESRLRISSYRQLHRRWPRPHHRLCTLRTLPRTNTIPPICSPSRPHHPSRHPNRVPLNIRLRPNYRLWYILPPSRHQPQRHANLIHNIRHHSGHLRLDTHPRCYRTVDRPSQNPGPGNRHPTDDGRSWVIPALPSPIQQQSRRHDRHHSPRFPSLSAQRPFALLSS